MLVDMAEKLFADLTTDRSAPFATLWPRVEEMGFGGLLLGEEEGGFGGDAGDAFAVLKTAGAAALPLPLAEEVFGRLAAARAGVVDVPGIVTIATRWDGGIAGRRFTGTTTAVPWGREAGAVVLTGNGPDLLVMARGARVLREDANPAGEPRDTLSFEGAEVHEVPEFSALHWGALSRSAQIAGALDRALAMSIEYANERVQFGRPIGKFQSVQHSLAIFAMEASAALSAGQAAARAAEVDAAHFEIAVAKCRASQAAAVGHASAHAAHGAIGFTMEHGLNHLTRRLIAWRSEFGGQAFWADRIGEHVLTMPPGQFWPNLTARSDVLSRAAGSK